MRTYAVVSPKFWTGKTGKRIRAAGRDTQVVALYLITAPSSNLIGLYYLALPTLCHEVGITLQGARKALRSLSEVGFAFYDGDSETVFVPEMARFQTGESLQPKDNRIKAVIEKLAEARSSRFAKDFHDKYVTVYHLPPMDFAKPLRTHSEAPSEPLRSQDQEQEQEQKQEQKKTDAGTPPPAAGGVTGFEEFYEAYPRKQGKEAALKVWRKLKPNAVLLETIRAALAVQKASADWRRENGRFIPHPATWLNGRRWTDQPTSNGPVLIGGMSTTCGRTRLRLVRWSCESRGITNARRHDRAREGQGQGRELASEATARGGVHPLRVRTPGS